MAMGRICRDLKTGKGQVSTRCYLTSFTFLLILWWRSRTVLSLLDFVSRLVQTILLGSIEVYFPACIDFAVKSAVV